MKKTISGFTIVELLIVIVVIAILATISIVAYTGIQTRARETQILNDLSGLAKQLHLFQAENGRYPSLGQLPGMNMRPSIPNTNGTRIIACMDNANGSTFAIYVRMESDANRNYRVTHQSSPEKLASPLASWVSSDVCTGATPNASWGSNWVAGWTAP